MGAALSHSKFLSHVRRILEIPFLTSKSYHRSPLLIESAFVHESKLTCPLSEKPLIFEPTSEQVREFNSCPDASRASCKFADSGPREVDVLDLKLYRQLVPGSDGYIVVGVGLQSSSGDIIPLVLIENDDEHGIHFTGRLVHDPSECLVACLRHSSRLHPVVRHIIYLDFLRNLQNRSATFIWDWWSSGADMDRIDRQIRDGQ
ncbi:hypothetical protein FRC08_005907 [Ceratobasidium sp. 394]|nr:hypothetical protein FRC08_005907 [Ceratobasidium sp. 394]KAG9093208.1 hypothetical protein FS749_014847 [Ceratobasidium sp. UAMH 11750]